MIKKIIKDKRFIVISIAIVLVFLVADFNQRIALLTRLRRQEKELNQRYTQLEATRTALQNELDFAQSEQAVERWAREDAMMIQEGDVPFVLVPPSEQLNVQPTETPAIVEEIKPWQIWRELFFQD